MVGAGEDGACPGDAVVPLVNAIACNGQAETAYAKTVLADTAELQEALYREMRGRIQEADQSAPIRSALFCRSVSMMLHDIFALQVRAMHTSSSSP